MALITYADKQAMGTQPSIPAVNKVTDSDMNEIKESVNALYPVVLYDNASGFNGTITLSDDVNNYEYIEIYYRSNDGYINSKRVIASNNYVDLVAFQPLKTADVVTYAKLRVILMNNNTISTRQEGGDFFAKEILVSNTGYQQTATNNIFITRVLGYK